MFNSRTVPHTHSQRISTPLASTFIRRVISTGPLSAFKSSRMHRSPSSALYSTHIRHALNSPISGRNPGGELTDPIKRRYSAVFRRQPRSRVQDARVFFFMAKVFRFSCFRFVDLSVLSCLFLWLAFVDVYGFCSSLFYRVAFRSRVISRLFIWLRRIPWRVSWFDRCLRMR